MRIEPAAENAAPIASAAPNPIDRLSSAIAIGVKNCNPRVTLSSTPSAELRTLVGSSSETIGPTPYQIPVPTPAQTIAAGINPAIPTAQGHRIVGGSRPTAIIAANAENTGRRPKRSASAPKLA